MKIEMSMLWPALKFVSMVAVVRCEVKRSTPGVCSETRSGESSALVAGRKTLPKHTRGERRRLTFWRIRKASGGRPDTGRIGQSREGFSLREADETQGAWNCCDAGSVNPQS